MMKLATTTPSATGREAFAFNGGAPLDVGNATDRATSLLEEIDALATFVGTAFEDAGALGERSELTALKPAIVARTMDVIARLSAEAAFALEAA